MDALHPLDQFLLVVAARGALVLAAASVLLWLLRRRLSASARHAGWLMALVALAVVSWVPERGVRWRVELPRFPTSQPEPAPEVARAQREPATTSVIPDLPPSVPPEVEPEPLAARGTRSMGTPTKQVASEPARPRPWLAWAWLVGVALALVRPLVGLVRARRWIADARPVPSALRAEWGDFAGPGAARTRLLECERAAVPMTWGAFRPVVLVPCGFAEWPAAARRAALRHELAHVRRGDWLAQAFARLAAAVHWVDPLAWLALRRLRSEAEHACDDAALEGESSGAEYAGQLLWVARGLGRSRAPAGAVAMARASLLEQRVHALLDPRVRRSAPGRMPCAVAWSCALLLAGALSQTEVACAGAETVQEPTAVVTVAPDGSADHTSIQAAIDAAPAGALVRIAPGTYEERLVVDKALTLEGENWSRTRISFPLTSAMETEPELALSMTNEMNAVQSDLERLRIRERYFREHGPWPVLRVEGAGPVNVSGLQFALTGEIYVDRTAQMAAVWIDRSQVVLRACAVTGSPGSGIGILTDSDVKVLSTFVGGIGGSGIAIIGDGLGPPPRVLVADCELRGFGQQAIAIESGNTSTRIEHCRISGSWTYGIHYEDASPVIEGNEIFDNEVAGVHATGSTSAVVRENLIRSNRRTGMSCVFENGDTIERNTFTGNYESGLEILGAARPSVHRNVFHDSPSGVFVDQVSEGKEARQRRPDSVDIRFNIFASVRQWIRLESLKPAHSEHQRVVAQASEGDNRFVDPGFVDPEVGDFRLRKDSEARALGIGAGAGAQPDADSTGLEPNGSTARPTEGEARLTAKYVERQAMNERRMEENERHRAASAVAEPWIEGLMRIWNDEARAQAFAQMCEALESDDPLQRHAGLIALAASSDVNLDRERLVPRLIELARIETGQAQVQAMYGLESAGHRPDCELVRSLLRDDPSPALRASGVALLSWACAQDFTGATGQLVLSLLERAPPIERRQHLSSLRGVTVSKEIESWILEIESTATDPDAQFDALSMGLSGIQNKSSEVINRLIEALSSRRASEGEWALWGLGFGVVPEAHERVADAALSLFEARSGMDWREGALDLLESYGSAKHLASVRALAAEENLVPPLRQKAERAAAAIETRAGD